MKDHETTAITRLGVAPRFPKPATFIRQWQRVWQDVAEPESLLRQYASGKPVYLESKFVPEKLRVTIAEAGVRLGMVGHHWSYRAQVDALLNQAGWLDAMRRATGYFYWSERLNVRWHHHALEEFRSGQRRQKLQMLFLEQIVFVIGSCAALGWMEMSKDLALRALRAIDDDLYNDADEVWHRRGQYFTLRLISDWQGWQRTWPSFALDRPVYNALVASWRTARAEDLIPALLAACDRHTHEARFDNNREMFDFGQYEYMYFPFEILTLFRLRVVAGLTHPEVDHSLLKTPLGRLPGPQPEYTDELLEGVLAVARREFPDL
jgi:hypothetical protein